VPESESDFDDLPGDLGEYLQIYLDETDEQLDDLVETMLSLEKDPQEAASLSAAFRLLHSMKGAAGMMGFDQITVLTHHLETRFERLRSGRIQLDRVTMNLTLRCIDFLRQCNQRLRAEEAIATPDELLKELYALEVATEKNLEQTIAKEAPPPRSFQDTEPDELDQADDPGSYSLPDPGTDYHVIVLFEDQLQLKDLKAQSIAAALGNLGEVKATRPSLDELGDDDFDAFDVIVNTTHSIDQMIEASMLEGVTEIEIRVPREPDRKPLAKVTLPKILAALNPSGFTTPSLTNPSATVLDEVSETALDSPSNEPLGEPVPKESLTSKPTKKTLSKVVDTMRVDIGRLDLLMNLAGELVVNRAQFLQVVSEISPALRKSGAANRSRDFVDLLKQIIVRLGNHATQPEAVCHDWSTSIRELESGIELIEDQMAQWENSRRCFARLDEAIDQLSRVSASLQRGVLGARMIPVGPLLGRFKRVVRDLSVQRDKDVILEISGEATELDKRMIDALGDPLVHLVRNSIDHGLERTADRIAAGKPAQGKVSLSAKHRGNHVYIMISDDGAGINDTKIRQRLVDRGIVTADVAKSLSRNDAIQYIWHPGFSTAEAVTDVSGRGVGMDIVKSRIEELTGTIEIESVPGQGTTFTLKLPLTLAIISSLLVKIRGIVFAIPMDDVREIVSVRDQDIVSIHGKKTFEVRSQYVPLVAIDDVLTWHETSTLSETDNPATTSSRMSEVAILHSAGRMMGLRVDRLIGSQDVVIKSLTDNFIGIHGLAGASILGDGTVALMLDVAALLMMTVQPRESFTS